MEVHWRASDTKDKVTFAASITGTGWVALGVAKQGGQGCAMTGADVAIGSDSAGVAPYHLTGCQAPTGVDSAQTITEATATTQSGKTTVQFTRALNNGGTGDPLVLGSMQMVVAYHKSSDSTTDYHRGRVKVTLNLGDAPASPPSPPSATPSAAPTAAPAAPSASPTQAPSAPGGVSPPSQSPALPPTSSPSGAPTASPSPAAQTMPPSAPGGPAPTGSPAAGSAVCTVSALPTTTGGTTTYSCVKEIKTGVRLHWRRSGAKVDIALEKEAASGWLALGVGATRMTGADVLVGQANGATAWYKLGSYRKSSFSRQQVPPFTVTSTAVSTESGRRILRLKEIEFQLPQDSRRAAGEGSTATPRRETVICAIRALAPTVMINQARFIWARHDSDVADFPGQKHADRGDIEVDMLSGAAVASSAEALDPDLVKSHGVLVLVAWCFLAPLAIVIKRYPDVLGLKGKSAAGKPLAFLLHAGLMCIAALFTLITLLIAWVGFDGKEHHHPEYAHGEIAWVVFVLVVCQLIPAIGLRPEPNSPKRPYFNYFHWTVGGLAVVFGVTNVITGTKNFEEIWDEDEGKLLLVVAIVGIVMLFVAGMTMEVYRKTRGGTDAAKPTFSAGNELQAPPTSQPAYSQMTR